MATWGRTGRAAQIDALLHPPVVLGCRFVALDQLSGGWVVAGLGQGRFHRIASSEGTPSWSRSTSRAAGDLDTGLDLLAEVRSAVAAGV